MRAPHESTGTDALDKFRIIDIGRVLGAPFCPQILVEHGAGVLAKTGAHGQQPKRG